MARIGSSGPPILLDQEFVPKLEERISESLRKLHRRDPFALRRLLDFLAMLIHPGKKECRLACHSIVPGDHIAEHDFVSVTDVRARIGIRDSCSNKIFRWVHSWKFCKVLTVPAQFCRPRKEYA